MRTPPRPPAQRSSSSRHAPARRIATALVVLASLGGVARAVPVPPGPAPGPAASTTTPAPGGDAAMLLSAADDITRQVAALRGLEPKRAVAKGVLSREAIGDKLRERIAKEYTPDEIRVESRVLQRLGLLPPDADYDKLLVDLLMEQVAGFYDPFSHRLYIADWLGVELQRPAMAHEIEHALQDQHFDLKAFTAPLKDDGDKQLARAALVEGDGTAVMLEFVAQQMGLDVAKMPDMVARLGRQLQDGQQSQLPAFTRAPRFLRETLLFPYFAGLDFVVGLRMGHPWKRVDEAFRNPPESTEQVMHLDKYLAHERPVAITPAPLDALAPATEVRRDVLGEFEWKLLFASQMDDGTAGKAAAGWGGDRMVAYGMAGDATEGAAAHVTVIDLSAWDTVGDAEEAEAAARKLLARQLRQPEPAQGEPGRFVADEHGRSLAWTVERRAQRVLVMWGVPADAAEATASEVWAKWKGDAKASAGKGAPAAVKEKEKTGSDR